MTLEPAAVIQSFADSDTVQPGFQGAATAETTNAAKRFQENFLGTIGSVGHLAKHAKYQVEDGSVVMGDQPVECRFRAGLQLDDQFGFIAAPREGAGPIGHCRPFRPASRSAP